MTSPPTQYLSCKARLQIRLEDFVPPVQSLEAVEPYVPSLGSEAFGPGLAEQIFAFRDDTFTLDIVPKSAVVELNSYRLADSARVTVQFSKLPFDPRIIRAATVQIFGGSFDPGTFAASMVPGGPGLMLPDRSPPGRADALQSNELFRGFADNWNLRIPTDGKMEVDIEARDATGPMLDAELPPNALRDIPMNMPLDKVIQLLLTGDGAPSKEISRRFGLPGFRGIVVVNEAFDGAGDLLLDLPTIKQIRPPEWLDSAKKVRKKKRGGGNSQGPKVSYWDAITDLCVSAGYIVYIRAGTQRVDIPGVGSVLPPAEIVISNPRTYYANDPDTLEDLADFDKTRVFIFGINARDIEIERKLTGTKTPTVEVLSYSTDTGERLRARFPPKPVKNTPTVGSGDREEIKQFLLDEIGGPLAQERLEAAAKSTYEQLSRGEMRVKVKTRRLAARLANLDSGVEADLFQLRAGDPIRVEIDRKSFADGVVPPYTLFTVASPPERIHGMVAIGIPIVVAARVALAMDSPFLQTEFRCTRNTLSFNATSGWDAEIEGVNYLDVRNDVAMIERALGIL